MTTKWQWRRSGRLVCAGLAVAAIAPLSGCDVTEGIVAVARNTATQAATEAIGGVVNGLVGDVLPDSGG
jgi:hypothetical protein